MCFITHPPTSLSSHVKEVGGNDSLLKIGKSLPASPRRLGNPKLFESETCAGDWLSTPGGCGLDGRGLVAC